MLKLAVILPAALEKILKNVSAVGGEQEKLFGKE